MPWTTKANQHGIDEALISSLEWFHLLLCYLHCFPRSCVHKDSIAPVNLPTTHSPTSAKPLLTHLVSMVPKEVHLIKLWHKAQAVSLVPALRSTTGQPTK